VKEKLLYYCPLGSGGIVDYSEAQAAALGALGIDVILLAASGRPGSGQDVRTAPLQDETQPLGVKSRAMRRIRRAGIIRDNVGRLASYVAENQLRHVLFASFTEYAAPLWSRRLNAMARSGIRFGAMLHDPIRNYAPGPGWWHRWSIRRGYSFLSEVFVHEPVDRAEAGIPGHVRLTVVPQGPFDFPRPVESGGELRRRFDIPKDVRLLLSFGQIRDGKNLAMVIEALKEFPDVWLLVAGSEAGGANRPAKCYRELAENHGVAARCRWFNGFVAADCVGSYFLAADLVMLAYSRAFRSASGVLNAAVQFRRACLASSGQSALRTQVERHQLGVWVEPDDPAAIREGLRRWLRGTPEPLWSEYLAENSWTRNAEAVRQRMFFS
jgi:glycosyltransferase involved in cell wall biosynthesis